MSIPADRPRQNSDDGKSKEKRHEGRAPAGRSDRALHLAAALCVAGVALAMGLPFVSDLETVLAHPFDGRLEILLVDELAVALEDSVAVAARVAISSRLDIALDIGVHIADMAIDLGLGGALALARSLARPVALHLRGLFLAADTALTLTVRLALAFALGRVL
jgi:hypothetical protein